ncbi:MAG: hypothetical protein R3B58_03650 [Phycisphaerales bacterium]
MLLRIGDQFTERGSLLVLARCLCNAEKLDDLAASLLCVAMQRLFLHGERKALAFLLSAADACQCRKPFHDDGSCDNTEIKRLVVSRIVTASSMESGSV